MAKYKEDIVEYMAERSYFFRLVLVEAEDGTKDIMLRLDGTYHRDSEDMEGQLAYERGRLIRALENSNIMAAFL